MYDYPWELYNIEEDATEQHNLVRSYPELVEEMDTAYRAWIDRADRLTGITNHKWFQPRFTKEQQKVVELLDHDRHLQKFLDERKEIGLQIVEELKRLKVKMKTGLGMENVPMSYFGLVKEGRVYSGENEQTKQLYDAWDQNVKQSEAYCRSQGKIYLDVWCIQERIRPNTPATDE